MQKGYVHDEAKHKRCNKGHSYSLMPEPNRKRVSPLFALMLSAKRNVRDTVIAVSIDTRTPSPKTSAKPLMSDVPNQKRMTAVIMEEMLESRTVGHGRPNPSCLASSHPLPPRSSSFMRSNLSSLASANIPTEGIKAAIPSAV